MTNSKVIFITNFLNLTYAKARQEDVYKTKSVFKETTLGFLNTLFIKTLALS